MATGCRVNLVGSEDPERCAAFWWVEVRNSEAFQARLIVEEVRKACP